MVWVAFFVLLGAVARAAREVAIAYRYGISAEVDAYLFVFNLINWPIAVWGNVLVVVLVPLAARIRNENPGHLPVFRRELLGAALVLGLLLVLLDGVALPWVLQSSWAGLAPVVHEMASGQVWSLSLLSPLGVLVGLFSAWMLLSGRHANTLLEAVPSLAMLVAVFVVADSSLALICGTLLGFACHLACLMFAQGKARELGWPSLSFSSGYWRGFSRAFLVMLAGQLVMTSSVVIDQFFAGHLGAGALATLGYANRLLGLVLGVGALAVSRATLPVFSAAVAEGGGTVQRVALRWVWLLFAFGLLCACVGCWLAPWIVELLFERGAFTAADTLVVGEAVQYGVFQLPFYLASMALVSLLASQGRYLLMTVAGGLNLLVKLLFNTLLVPLWGVNGLMLSVALMYVCSVVFLLLAVIRQWQWSNS